MNYKSVKIVVRNYCGACFELVGFSLSEGKLLTGADKFIMPAKPGVPSVWNFELMDRPISRFDFSLEGDWKPHFTLSLDCRSRKVAEVTVSASLLQTFVDFSLQTIESVSGEVLSVLVDIRRNANGAFVVGE